MGGGWCQGALLLRLMLRRRVRQTRAYLSSAPQIFLTRILTE